MTKLFTASVWQEANGTSLSAYRLMLPAKERPKMRLSITCATLLNCTSLRRSPRSCRTCIISK